MNNAEQLQKLRVPFAENQISYLPKGGVKLAYVGHAALTDRLLDVDPAWTWEPLSVGPDGLPQLDSIGGLWIKLTVCGVTRLGYGDAGAKEGCNAMKERIGDGLRNAAMRFGAALDLWHKGDLHGDDYAEPRKVVTPALPKIELDAETQTYLREMAVEAIANVKSGNPRTAYESIEAQALDADQKTALWGMLDSTTRSAIKTAKTLPL